MSTKAGSKKNAAKVLTRLRKSKSKQPAKRGRKSWIYGTKLSFFEKMRPGYLKAKETSDEAVGLWARSAAIRYKLAYGEIAPKADLKEEPEMPDDEEVIGWQEGYMEGLKELPKAEADAQLTELDALRTVRCYLFMSGLLLT